MIGNFHKYHPLRLVYEFESSIGKFKGKINYIAYLNCSLFETDYKLVSYHAAQLPRQLSFLSELYSFAIFFCFGCHLFDER